MFVEEETARDAKEPDRFLTRALTPIAAGVATDPVEHVLHEIFGVGLAPGEAEEVLEQRAVIALEQIGQEVVGHGLLLQERVEPPKVSGVPFWTSPV